MAMELFFENLIKIEEAASSGLNLMKKEKGNPNLQFFLFLQKELDCNVVFTKGENDEDCRPEGSSEQRKRGSGSK